MSFRPPGVLRVVYRAYGLTIESDIAVPGAQPAEGEPVLRIVREPVSPQGASLRTLPPYTMGVDGRLLIEIPGAGRFLVDPLRQMLSIEPGEGASEYHVGSLLIATALPAALWLRGDLVLHAASARLPDKSRAIAIAGPSGSGKSTLLRRLIAAGSQVVGDDTLCLREMDGGFQASGLPAATQLRMPCPSGERQMIPVPPTQQATGAQLGALVVLGMPGNGKAGLSRLSGIEALTVILCNLHRRRVPELAGLTPAILPRVAALAREVAVYSWTPLKSNDGALPELRLLASVSDTHP